MEEMSKIVKGFSLIAKELAKNTVDVPSNRSLVKQAVISVTDLAGLTKGSRQSYSNPNPEPLSQIQQFQNHRHLDQDQSDKRDHQVLHQDQLEQQQLEEDKLVEDPLSVTIKTESGTPGKDHESLVPKITTEIKRRRPRERRVPSTPFSRALGFAGLGAGLAWGTLQESAKRIVYGNSSDSNNQNVVSPFLSPQNAERLALALCRMRGAALKIGQMLSIQDESLVPPPILAALDIVRQGADVMPRKQLDQVINAELGPDWSSKLISFNYEPLAAASIGQVHQAVTKDGLDVAMKIQYPGVANSIDSDIENVKLLLNYTNLIPKGLYLDRAIKVAKEELSRECDYELEASNQKRFREMLSQSNREGYYVPLVVDDLSSKRVLTTELISGIPIDKVASSSQDTRNYVGKKLLEITLMELFVFRFMQTDPNWSNFLYDESTKTINLIDFGAARDFSKHFVDDYLRMVLACANGDRTEVIERSKSLGFLTGMESEIMIETHVQAGFVVGLPFSKAGGFDFRSTNITQSVSNLGATMLKHRLTPPPDEAYSLHRKLSGAFLACIKLGAVVPCRELLLQISEHHRFGEEGHDVASR